MVWTAMPRSTHVAERVELVGVPRIAHLDEVVREEYRVEVEALEAATVHGRDRQAVAGDPDESDQPLSRASTAA